NSATMDNYPPDQQRIRHVISSRFSYRPVFSVRTRLTSSWNRYVLIDDIRETLSNDNISLFLDEEATLPIRVFSYVHLEKQGRGSHQTHIAFFPDQVIYYRGYADLYPTTTTTATRSTTTRTTSTATQPTTTRPTTRTQPYESSSFSPAAALQQTHALQQKPFLLSTSYVMPRTLAISGQPLQEQGLEEEDWGDFPDRLQFSETRTPHDSPPPAAQESLKGDNAERPANENQKPSGPAMAVIEQIDTTFEVFREYIRLGSDALRHSIVEALQNSHGGDGGDGSQMNSENTAAVSGDPDRVARRTGTILRTSARTRTVEVATTDVPTHRRQYLPIESPFAAPTRARISNFSAAVTAAAGSLVTVAQGTTTAGTTSRRGGVEGVVLDSAAPRTYLPIESPFAASIQPRISNSAAAAAAVSPNPTTSLSLPPTYQQQPPIDYSPSADHLVNTPIPSVIDFPYSNTSVNNLPEVAPQDFWTEGARAQREQPFQREAQIRHQADMQFRAVQGNNSGRGGGVVRRGGGRGRGSNVARASRRPVGILGPLVIPPFRRRAGTAPAPPSTAAAAAAAEADDLQSSDNTVDTITTILKKSRSNVGPLDMQNPNSAQFRIQIRRRRLRRHKSEPPLFPEPLRGKCGSME
ncbi:hypothetical protein BGW39_006060, partial [Mortierella sp. 14UC]